MTRMQKDPKMDAMWAKTGNRSEYRRADGHVIRKEIDRPWWLVYSPDGTLIPSPFGGVVGGPTLWWAQIAVATEIDGERLDA